MRRWLPIRLLSLLLCALAFGPAAAAPAAGVVTGACTQADLHTALSGGGLIPLPGSFTSTPRLFAINPGLSVTLKNLMLANGQSGPNDGGIILNHGTLT